MENDEEEANASEIAAGSEEERVEEEEDDDDDDDDEEEEEEGRILNDGIASGLLEGPAPAREEAALIALNINVCAPRMLLLCVVALVGTFVFGTLAPRRFLRFFRDTINIRCDF